MKISVIIPFYQELDLIPLAFESIAMNTKGVVDVEIIVSNDGKIENQRIEGRIPSSIKSDVKVISNLGSRGPGGARNSGLNLSTGDIIMFLDADDSWLPSKVEAQISGINLGATFSATGYKFSDRETYIRPPSDIKKPIDIFSKRGIGTSTVAVSRRLLKSHRFRDIRFGQDIDFWYRLSHDEQFVYKSIDAPYAVYSTNGTTKNKFQQFSAMLKILRLNKISTLNSALILSSYVKSGIMNHYIRVILNHKK